MKDFEWRRSGLIGICLERQENSKKTSISIIGAPSEGLKLNLYST
jgi:hypothetical protein